jgi:hypothetical protein
LIHQVNQPATALKTVLTFASLLLITTSIFASDGPGNRSSKNRESKSVRSGKESLSLSLVNQKGEVLLQQQVITSQATVNVSLPQMPAGLYLVELEGSADAQKQKISFTTAE